MISTDSLQQLRSAYAQGMEEVRAGFEANGDGLAAVLARTRLVDDAIKQRWEALAQTHPECESSIAVVAVGGYGREALFPYSDVDLLFLCDSTGSPQQKQLISGFCQDLWDVGWKLSPATRVLAECAKLNPDNLEFSISLLDARFLAGHHPLFSQLKDDALPKLLLRSGSELVELLLESYEQRYRRMDGTIFHLEPHVKEGPGALRDFNLACWLSLVHGFEQHRKWRPVHEQFPPESRSAAQDALAFLSATRVFLHFRNRRDENQISWDMQRQAAAIGIGMDQQPTDAAGWMQRFYRSARTVQKLVRHISSDVRAGQSSVYQRFQSWRGRHSDPQFAVAQNTIFFQEPGQADLDTCMRAFEFSAQHGLSLSAVTERTVQAAVRSAASTQLSGSRRWQWLRKVLLQPHCAHALRTMQETGALELVLPQFHVLEALVIRDFYHRYTVDEHTFRAIDSLHRLERGVDLNETEKALAGLLASIDAPEVLYLSVLLHDIGKGTGGDDHLSSGFEIAMQVCEDFDLAQEERDIVCFLVAYHLDFSRAMRRDIFEHSTIKALGEKVGDPARLKLLTLLTYADIRAVNPDAMTAWKAENMWHLYVAAVNYLNRTVDDHRFHQEQGEEQLARLHSLAPRIGRKLKEFLEGLPDRYLRVHTASEIVQHVEMASQAAAKGVEVALRRKKGGLFELVVITSDRSMLFADLAGILTGWGMSIVKADVFANSAGMAVDTFLFKDRFNTLELNLQEWQRFQESFAGVHQHSAVKVSRRFQPAAVSRTEVPTRVHFDSESSAHSTLMEIVAQDCIGLLHSIGTVIAESKCNIEVAIIDTEGEAAIDVFYLTKGGRKLEESDIQAMESAMLAGLAR